MGLIATKTIAEGTTRQTSLSEIIDKGGRIYEAISKQPWPGSANVYVSIVHISRGIGRITPILNSKVVSEIDSYLSVKLEHNEPKPLLANAKKCFQGTKPRGKFDVPNDLASDLLKKDPNLSVVLRPYVRGQDIKRQIDPQGTDHIIDFANVPHVSPESFPTLYEICREQVKPYRDDLSISKLKEKWWLFEHRSDELYDAIHSYNRVICTASLSDHFVMTWCNTGCVFSNQTTVFAVELPGLFAVLHSTLHEIWCRRYSSYFKGDLRYLPNYCFSTYPLPSLIGTDNRCVITGDDYYTFRHELMVNLQEGLTEIYNHFHDPAETAADIVRLRELHVEMDNAVASAYGWSDLVLGHGFHETAQGIRYTLSEPARREVLTRLLHLNHQRHEEELRQGIHEGKKSTPSKKSAEKGIKNKQGGQMSLL